MEWELDGIEQSDYVCFYFDPATKSPVSLLEFGLAIGLDKQVLIACPTGFWRKGNIDVLAKRKSLTVHESLEALLLTLQNVLHAYRKELS